ncbi:PspC domain-containing protein [Streptacidiphilus sp. MAP12-16]|uniref:PspC domain-containing protein n=1 Tax=Streptacidiphilus sp. MAP12-16 TaxID=3156300 RepID=UPI003512266B
MTEDTPAPPAPPQPNRPARPPLERSRDRRVVAGVCGGLGRHLDIDPVVFRVVIAVLCLSGGVGLFIYGMAWLVVPVERTGRNELQRLLSGRVDGQSLGAVLVTLLGTGIFFSYMGDSGHIFPLLLIAALAFAALRYDPAKHPRRWQQPTATGDDSDPNASAGGAGWAAFRTQAPAAAPAQPSAPVPPPAPAWWQRPDPLRKPEAAGSPADAPPQPSSASCAPSDARPDAPFAPPMPPFTPPPPPFAPRPPGREPRRRDRSFLGSVFFFLAVITSGLVWVVAEKNHHSVNVLVVLASGLLVLGLGLLVGARWGRGRSLVVWATLLTLAVAAVGASPVQLHTSYQRVTWAPTTVSALQPSYKLDAGQATLDLSRLSPTPGQSLTTEVHLGAGKVQVILPTGPEVRVSAHAGVGDVRLPDDSNSGGFAPSRNADLNPGGAAAHGTIVLDVAVGAGQVEVTQ